MIAIHRNSNAYYITVIFKKQVEIGIFLSLRVFFAHFSALPPKKAENSRPKSGRSALFSATKREVPSAKHPIVPGRFLLCTFLFSEGA